jgi:CHAP domain
MAERALVRKRIAMGALLALGFPASFHAAQARPVRHASAHRPAIHHVSAGPRRVSDGLQCVPFARNESGIELTGNAATWWNHAVGLYERGNRPEIGSVLNFKANPRMRLGHVAVVTAVLNSREVEIDQANWAGPGGRHGAISRGIPVVDVSPDNDWTAVRVGLGDSGDFGSIYPTYGFIYDRADIGTVLAAAPGSAPTPDLNPAPSDLRIAAERPADGGDEEVAEAPADAEGIGMRHARVHRASRRHHGHAAAAR